MRGERAARDTRHNKDVENLKSSLKKGNKSKKHRVVFDESANEFFEADYIIVVRDESGYSDEGEAEADGPTEECAGCSSCGRYEPDPGALSPPDGYKDRGLFNRDGTLREQAWWEAEAGDVLLVGERSGTVFTPQHLQLLRRLQRERMLRTAAAAVAAAAASGSPVCADCNAHHHHHRDIEYGYEAEEGSESDEGACQRPSARHGGKHIAAGEERPRTNSSQQTTPTDECPSDIGLRETIENITAAVASEETDTSEREGRHSADSSPLRHRRGGILKGGRLWKSLDAEREANEQVKPLPNQNPGSAVGNTHRMPKVNDDQRSTTTASDEDGSTTTRSVRFLERPLNSDRDNQPGLDSDSSVSTHAADPEMPMNKDYKTHKLETPLILTNQAPKANSAVQQLFNSGRPPPPTIEPQLITSETLKAWDAGARPRSDEMAVRRVAERNALRCSLLRSEARKKQQPKQETTSLAERIRLLTCDVDDEPNEEKNSEGNNKQKNVEKSSTSADKSNEKAFGSASSSSSSSTLSTAAPLRHQPLDLGDNLQETTKPPRPESRRQFLSTLAPLTACVGSAAHHEGFYYVPPSDRSTASAATNIDVHGHNEAPAPDIVAGTPGANDGDDSLSAFAKAAEPRTDRLRQRYVQDSQPLSSDDEHDDYGFNRRPAVRGIAVKQQLAASDDILQQMQDELSGGSVGNNRGSANIQATGHPCSRNNYSWPYYSEANLSNSRPQSRASASSTWSSKSDYSAIRACGASAVQQSDTCYVHAQTVAYAYQHHPREGTYANCSLYANTGYSDSSQELYSSQASSEQTSPVRTPRCRRPESPPPIRSHHRLLYVPTVYSPHYHYQRPDAQYSQWTAADYGRAQAYYHHQHQHQQQQQQQQPCSTTPVQPAPRNHFPHAFQLQPLCPAPVRYRAVPAQQPGTGKQMICYSEKVAPPLYQAATTPASPSRAARGAPEGLPAAGAAAASATSPVAPPPNPVYYAMNV